MLIVLLSVLGVGLLIGLAVFAGSKDDPGVDQKESDALSRADKGAMASSIYAIIAAIIVGIVLLCTNVTSARDSRDLETFYYNNVDVYRDAVNETEDAVYIEVARAVEAQLISGENWKQSTNWSDRIKELQDKVAAYNVELRAKRYWNQNIWTNWFIRAPSADLKYLRLR